VKGEDKVKAIGRMKKEGEKKKGLSRGAVQISGGCDTKWDAK
jgi:hypothetical protein